MLTFTKEQIAQAEAVICPMTFMQYSATEIIETYCDGKSDIPSYLNNVYERIASKSSAGYLVAKDALFDAATRLLTEFGYVRTKPHSEDADFYYAVAL